MHLNSIITALYTAAPHFASLQRKETTAQANGRRYEEKVGRFLRSWAQHNNYELKDHPWIFYKTEDGPAQYAQPDYLLLSNSDDNLIIVEVKVRNTRDVLSQLRRYRSLITLIHPSFTPSLVEICRYFDPSECHLVLLPQLKPHPFDVAAMIFEPQEWTQAIN